ncbi:hypothetical protein DY000_02035872 [Brassica cretica]|uniref:Uncharacterized protein n=1 Tax=Brassica cretica TaxID=69181 RepID=A0ABQ7DWE2_BRACR|nr:hypothetical protein DY000_02035872 [Brassica cretica]
MMPNLRSLVAKAYRVRQGRAFCSSSSSAPNPIGGNSIVRYLVSRGVIMITGFGAATYSSGDKVAKYEEKMKAVNPLMHAIIFCVFRLTMMLGRPWRCCTWTCPNPNYLMLIVEVGLF